jgi:hypothetical protein
MPITTWWYETQQPVAVSRFDGDWVWGDFWQAMEDFTAMVKAVDGPVHLAIDMSTNKTVPGDAIQVGQRAFKQLAAMKNLQLMVFVNCNAYEDAIVRALVLLFPDFNRKVVFADSLEEALQVLAHTRIAVA